MGDTKATVTRPRARPDLTVVELDDEAIIYDAQAGQLHRLNSTGRMVFSLCDGRSTTHELAAELAEAYGLPHEEVETHVASLLANLQKAGLMERSRDRTAGAPLPPRPVATSDESRTRSLHRKRRGSP